MVRIRAKGTGSLILVIRPFDNAVRPDIDVHIVM